MGEMFNQKVLELTKHGEMKKAACLNSLDNTILPSYVRRIQQNDRTVMKDLVLPNWVTWELLLDWAESKKSPSERRCALCEEMHDLGMDFNNKFVCEHCFMKMKNMQ
jgi:hypothetical protein